MKIDKSQKNGDKLLFLTQNLFYFWNAKFNTYGNNYILRKKN